MKEKKAGKTKKLREETQERPSSRTKSINEMEQPTCVSCAKLLGPIDFLVDSALNKNPKATQASMFGKF